MSEAYQDFVAGKLAILPPAGLNVDHADIPLFPHQSVLTKWGLRRGRAAIFADTGLGKQRKAIAWAEAIHRATGRDVILVAPLAVGHQAVREGERVGIDVTHCRDDADVRPGLNVVNYERLHRLDTDRFIAVAPDESSRIKHDGSKTFATLCERFAHTPYKLCTTATPAPNDWTELGTHAEFLGVCSKAEMLAEYFVHDGAETQVWRLKGHARQQFWRWVASWGAMVRRPSDLGFDDSAYILPPLYVHEHIVASSMEEANAQGFLFPMQAGDLSERRNARKSSLSARVFACAEQVNRVHAPWVVWCELNAESEALAAAIPGAVEVRGSDDADEKERKLIDFVEGRIRILISKPSITGWGCNWQHCAHTAFVGVTDSWESYYQAVRRFWRFGQKSPVNVHLFVSEAEGSVLANLKRKEADASRMADELSRETGDAVRAEVFGTIRQVNPYQPSRQIIVPNWLISEAA